MTPVRQPASEPVMLPTDSKVGCELEYHVRDLGTSSVTLFPSRAQVVRCIKDVRLQSGATQITVVGLTPTLDEHTVRIESTGSEKIIDMAVELLPNRDVFEEHYPDSDDDVGPYDDTDSDAVSDPVLDTSNGNAISAVREKLGHCLEQQKHAREKSASAERGLELLDAYANSLTSDHGNITHVSIADTIQTYRGERDLLFYDKLEGESTSRECQYTIDVLRKEEKVLVRTAHRELLESVKVEQNARQDKNKEKENQRQIKAEALMEKIRLRQKREKYWPKKTYAVRIILETAASGRGSPPRSPSSGDDAEATSSQDLKAAAQEESAAQTCDLTLSYMTTSAYWRPSYGLTLDTAANSGLLCFDACLTNQTSETWENCKVILSTSQPNFSGLTDTLPALKPWHICLAGKDQPRAGNHTDVLYSPDEKCDKARASLVSAPRQLEKGPRENMFRVPRTSSPTWNELLTGDVAWRSMKHDSDNKRRGFWERKNSDCSEYEPEFRPIPGPVGPSPYFDHQTPKPASEPEEFQESAFEETGPVTTYEIPGLKTLAPSSIDSKQRVTRTTFSDVDFSHTVVAKHRPAAYLQAQIPNTSGLTLLKGPAGLTLDGSFLGQTILPRCSAGDTFTLSLGIDPTIQVSYARPEVRHTQWGIFTKEDSAQHSRSVTLFNSSSNKPARITVLDQVPVSEDELLKIEILRPRGMVRGKKDGVTAGIAAGSGHGGGGGSGNNNNNNNNESEESWGEAAASLRSGGEVVWDVELNPGRAVKLDLVYQCVFPNGDHVVNRGEKKEMKKTMEEEIEENEGSIVW
ncbi:hypothetical protein F4778DRAFT_2179 [Xylariomycetidae sp. FL2044]|nr:hypothetical protein F4778DRAFT_2179 [Xylariomycetidae sp. FL2044]